MSSSDTMKTMLTRPVRRSVSSTLIGGEQFVRACLLRPLRAVLFLFLLLFEQVLIIVCASNSINHSQRRYSFFYSVSTHAHKTLFSNEMVHFRRAQINEPPRRHRIENGRIAAKCKDVVYSIDLFLKTTNRAIKDETNRARLTGSPSTTLPDASAMYAICCAWKFTTNTGPISMILAATSCTHEMYSGRARNDTYLNIADIDDLQMILVIHRFRGVDRMNQDVVHL